MAVYTHQINETNRLTADYDTYPTHYHEMIGEGIEIYVLESHRDDYDGISEQNEFARPFERFKSAWNHWDTVEYRSRREEAISRYLRLRGLRGIFKTLQGYSQSEWAQVVIYSADPECNDYLEDAYKALDRWFKGDVFTVSHEEAKVFTAEDGERITRWDTVDSVGGCFIDSDGDLLDFGMATFTW